MITYLVYRPPGAAADSNGVRFLADRFAWLAFVFPAFWLMAQRQWVAGIVVFLIQGLMTAGASIPGAALAGMLMELALRLLVGLEGPAFVGRRLEAKGFTLTAILPAPDLGTAELMYAAGLASFIPQQGETPLPRPDWTGQAPLSGAPGLAPGFGPFDTYGKR